GSSPSGRRPASPSRIRERLHPSELPQAARLLQLEPDATARGARWPDLRLRLRGRRTHLGTRPPRLPARRPTAPARRVRRLRRLHLDAPELALDEPCRLPGGRTAVHE